MPDVYDSATGRTTFNTTAPPTPGVAVWVLTWGGGDEPETPPIYVHATKTGALAEARNELAVCCGPDEIDRIVRELDGPERYADCAGASDSFMTLRTVTLGD